jgi:hypothetical protein
MPILLILLWSTMALADPLLDSILGYKYVPVHEYQTIQYEPQEQDWRDEAPTEGEHYSWDNLYLCQYCDTEIIIDPYEDMSEDDAYYY